jgi:hypothetical protein
MPYALDLLVARGGEESSQFLLQAILEELERTFVSEVKLATKHLLLHLV